VAIIADELLLRSPRWTVLDEQRERIVGTQQRLAALLAEGRVILHFDDGRHIGIAATPRGLSGLGAPFWLFAGLALGMVLASAAIVLRRPRPSTWLFALMCSAQAASLVAMAIESMPGLLLPPGFAAHALGVRGALDLTVAAVAVHISAIYPLPLRHGRWIAGVVWAACAALAAATAGGVLAHAWWWHEGLALACGLLAISLLSWSYRIERNPYAVLMRRFAVVSLATLALLCLALAATATRQPPPVALTLTPMAWYLFLSAMMMLLPVMARSPQMMRELAMLAGIGTITASLHLMLVSLVSLTPFSALTIALAAALVLYALARRWLLNPMTEIGSLSAERMFDRLYAIVRETEANPHEAARLLGGLLRDLFEPIDMLRMERRSERARVVGDGAALLVPLPSAGAQAHSDQSLLLRFAGRGKRMFTRDDARLTDRVVEQMRRAVAYDHAVERGRSEERMRIAQDLHDDIGARLLTLMYKAPTPEVEDYIRHTLKDLKTLTRGLAATEHRLSHAGAEWKTDIAQRLSAAQIELAWTFEFDHDLALSVVQWSALTRVLRELVSNTIQHSCATRVEISAALAGGDLRLLVCDDGIGNTPQAWSHGLGLGGVRKRVKLLGGDVRWRSNENGVGIACVVFIPALASRR
jgi:signal transduction histidine kinase